jgi:hypothetical protein
MKNRLWRSVRCDELIGFLVAFENKAKTLETCCEHPIIEIIDSNDSTSFSIHPAYVRHENTARRVYRGRSRLRAQNINIEDRSKNQIDQKLISIPGQPNEEFSDGLSILESDKSGLKVLALDEVVEVVIDTNDEENTDTMITKEFSLSEDFNVTIENAENQAKLDDGTVSSSSALTSMKSASWKIYNGTQKEETEDDISSDSVIPFRNSQKFNKLLPRKIQKNKADQRNNAQPKGQSTNQTVGDVTPIQNEIVEKENKDAIVAFRDPISEVIPTEHGLISSKHMILNIGDLVDIQNDRFTNKIGRVIKVSEDLVLVAMVGEFIKPLYVSPSKLRRANASHINIIY